MASIFEVQSFSEWKNQEIRKAFEAKKRLNSLNASDEDLLLAEEHLERTRKMQVSDYFHLYLNENFPGDEQALEQAVKGLSSKQIAELLLAYQKQTQDSLRALQNNKKPKFKPKD